MRTDEHAEEARPPRLHPEVRCFDVSERYESRHPLIPWLIKHAAAVMNYGQVGEDGKVPWERLRGKKLQQLLIPIGELVMFDTGEASSRREGRWPEGIFLGISDRNHYYLGIEGKIVTSRSLRRLPDSENSQSVGSADKDGRRLHSTHTSQVIASLEAECTLLGAVLYPDTSPMQGGEDVEEKDVWSIHPEDYQDIYDKTTGKKLPGDQVSEARRQETEFLKNLDAYEIVPVTQCYEAMGRGPIPCGWVDVNKGDEVSSYVRSRLW